MKQEQRDKQGQKEVEGVSYLDQAGLKEIFLSPPVIQEQLCGKGFRSLGKQLNFFFSEFIIFKPIKDSTYLAHIHLQQCVTIINLVTIGPNKTCRKNEV